MEKTNKKNAFLFQGVGTEYLKLLHLLNEEQKQILQHCCDLAQKEIDMDLWGYLFEATETKHEKMFNDWIAIYTCDYIVYRSFVEYGVKPDLLLGYSMGLITAMACAESISYETGLQMLLTIYQYPKRVSRESEAMAVIVGMTYDDITKIIQENSLESKVEIGSENNDFCIVISGLKDGVGKVMSIAESEGALKVKDVNAPYAFHSQHAGKGIEMYAKQVAEIEVKNSEIPIMSSFDQKILHESSELKEELVKNMTGRMSWKTAIQKIGEMGITSFVEVSLEESIVKFSKLINTDYEFLTYNKLLKMKAKAQKGN